MPDHSVVMGPLEYHGDMGLTEKSPLMSKFGSNGSCLSITNLARLVTFSSSFSEGWEIAIFSLIVVPITKEFALSGLQLGLLGSLPLLAGMIGNPFIGVGMDIVGRKPAIALTYCTCCVGCFLMASATGIITLGIGRAIVTLGIKAGVTCVTVYMTELSPAALRGVRVSVQELYLNIGVLSATFIAWYSMGLASASWRHVVALGGCAPAIALLMLLALGVPESPRYLYQVGKEAQAKEILHRALHGNEAEIVRTLLLWQQEAAARQMQRRETWASTVVEVRDFLKHRGFLIAMACWFARAGCGITMLNSYFTVFLKDEMTMESALRCFTIAGIMKTLALVPTVTWLIDSLGRRMLFVLSAIGCCIFMLIASTTAGANQHIYLRACCLIGFMMSFSFGYGPVAFVYCFEILPNANRGKAGAFSQIPSDVLNVVFMLICPILFQAREVLPFMLLTMTNCVAAIFFALMCPETKGLLLEEATESF